MSNIKFVITFGYPLPIPLPARRLRRLELDAYDASVLRPPHHKILATPVTNFTRKLFRTNFTPTRLIFSCPFRSGYELFERRS